MTSESERHLLLRIAREAITARLTGGQTPAVEPGPLASRRAGAFVTVLKHGELRGCIGHIEPDTALPRIVARCAVAACVSDPRFPPLTADELPNVALELSLLGPLEPISGTAEIEIGRHGLVVEQGARRGLLLPQVASEWNWDAETFVAQTCQKAGLPRDAWKHGAKLWRFEAEVFGEVRA